MATCLLTTGRLEPCKDAIGGIDKLFFLNYQQYQATIAAGVITSLLEEDGLTEPTAYEYIVRDSTSKLMQNINHNPDNGTTFIEQAVTAQLKVMTAADNEELMLMIYGRPQVMILDRRGKFWLCGLEWGCDITAGAADTGGAMGDFNGYNLTITGKERKFAYEVDAAAILNWTIVTGV